MYQLINPIQTFSQGMGVVPNMLNSMAMLQKQQQANQLQQMMMPYQQPEAQAELATKQAQAQYAAPTALAQLNLLGAQANRENMMANMPVMRNEKIIQTTDGFYAYNLLTGQTRPIMNPTGSQLNPIRQGMQITGSPQGGFSITTGGMQMTPPQQAQQPPAGQPSIMPQGGQPLPVSPQQINKLQQLTGAQGQNIQLMPASPHSRSSNSGSTLIDTNTGQEVSVPTTGTVGRFQKAMTAGDVVSPQLRTIYKQIEPFVGPSNFPKIAQGVMDRYTNTPNPGFDAYTSANHALLPQTGDLMLTDMGLNGTTENRTALQNSITPQGIGLTHAPDSAQSYAKNIADTLAGAAIRDNTYQKFLKGGIALQPQNGQEQAALQQAISDKIYWELRQQNAPSTTVNGVTLYKIDGLWHKKGGQ
jgi:hypothetical protein